MAVAQRVLSRGVVVSVRVNARKRGFSPKRVALVVDYLFPLVALGFHFFFNALFVDVVFWVDLFCYFGKVPLPFLAHVVQQLVCGIHHFLR